MSTCWSVEPSPRGDGLWFVAEDEESVSAFAPPGVWLPAPPKLLVKETCVKGWRQAVWATADDPLLDRDIPETTQPVALSDVCRDLPSELRAHVRDIMLRQLAIARSLGIACDGDRLVRDDEAHAGVQATMWILNELRAAFPHEEWLLPTAAIVPQAVPDTFDELLERLPPGRESRDGRGAVEPPTVRELVGMLGVTVLGVVMRQLDRCTGGRAPLLKAVAARTEPARDEASRESACASAR